MMLFEFKDTDAAIEFWQRVRDRDAGSEEDRTRILVEMAKEGLMKRVIETNRTKEEIIDDWSKHFNVLSIDAEKSSADGY